MIACRHGISLLVFKSNRCAHSWAIWNLKENNINHFILWHILSSRSPSNSANKRYNLCLKEKLLIIRRNELLLLHKRNEFVSSCRHRNKTLLRNNCSINYHETGLEGWKYSLFVFSSIVTYFALYSYESSTGKRKNRHTDFLYIEKIIHGRA